MHPKMCLKPRAVLTKKQAVDIFRIAGVLRPDGTRGTKPTASSVAKRYGVSEKTIRDIWRGRTWYEETLPFDMNRQPKTMMKTGRPLGRKDSAPRKRKLEIRTQKMKQTESESTDSRSYSNSEGEEEIVKDSCTISPTTCYSEFRKDMFDHRATNRIFQQPFSFDDHSARSAESRIVHQEQQWANLESSSLVPFPILQLPRMNGSPPQHYPLLPVTAFLQHGNPASATIQPPPQRLLPSLSTLCSCNDASLPVIGSQGQGFLHPPPLGPLPPPPTASAPFAAFFSSAGGSFGRGVRAIDGRPSGPPMSSTADLLRSLLSMQPWPCR